MTGSYNRPRYDSGCFLKNCTQTLNDYLVSLSTVVIFSPKAQRAAFQSVLRFTTFGIERMGALLQSLHIYDGRSNSCCNDCCDDRKRGFVIIITDIRDAMCCRRPRLS